MTSTPVTSTPVASTRTEIVWSLVRALLSMTILVALYYAGPLDGLRSIPIGISLAVAVAILVGIGVWQVRAISTSDHPRLRGVEALSVTVPLYILLFAAAYYAMASQDAGAFDVAELTRTDTLYFTVTVFSSVGFGDIYAASQGARVLVTVQMILNLLVLGAGIRVFVSASRRRRGDGTFGPTRGDGQGVD
ncbi:potassium channel family protein [uncultured Microbacterium sp.]|uniref:potassium channel family protein n=1 Tax=uncultured Microbacterium sp. TaxID=191216 RepID=UPI0028D3BBE2|nr:potassium channel family protein [uncultured Microbacterium sp.]